MYKIILHPTDLSENHYDMCKQAADIAHYFKAKLHLLHVIQLPSSIQIAQSLGFTELASPATDDAKTVMNLLGESLNIPAEQQHVEVGSIRNHILDLADKLGCGLIILGSQSPNSISSFLGSTAQTILHHAPCDVLTLRASG